jgi:hypothetical protein
MCGTELQGHLWWETMQMCWDSVQNENCFMRRGVTIKPPER